MKVKLLAVLLLAAVIGFIGMTTARSESSAKVKKPSEKAANALLAPDNKVQPVQPVDDDPYVIDGAKHPELIPDHVAYSLLFRLIANRKTDEEKGRIRAYIGEMGLGRPQCKTCPKVLAQDSGRGTDADVDALIAAAEEYNQRVSVLDRQAKELKERGKAMSIPNVKGQLTALQKQKEALVTQIVNSLPSRLSAHGLEKVHRHINNRVKQKVKIRSAPDRRNQVNPDGSNAT